MSSRTSYWSIIVDSWRIAVVLAITIPLATVFAQNSSNAREGNSIKSILNANGSIRPGAPQGSFDAHGYRMVTSSDGSPRFVKTTNDPNDKNWDPSFTVAGVGGAAYVVTHNADTLYVGGGFGSAGSLVANSIAKYNLTTNSWFSFDSTSADLGTDGVVYAILVNGTDVYIGGSFSDAGGVAANNIVDYNTATGHWSTLGAGTSNGVDNRVNTMLYFGGNLYVGGEFANAGGNSASGIARWDGSAWHNLGSGVNTMVWALAVYNGALYVGGDFTSAGGSTADYIAKWDGTSWSTVGATATDLSSTVYCLAVANNGLYIGGDFTTAGMATVNGLTRWDGTTWNTVGSGVDGDIYGLILSGTKFYVTGSFTTAGLITTNNVATVDTSTKVWAALGAGSAIGTNTYTWVSDVVNNVFYMSGPFSVAGVANAFGVASWNGTTWSSLGGTTNVTDGNVDVLAISGSTIYVGGGFENAGNLPANHVAAYNTLTHAWSSLGLATANGVDNTVDAISVVGGNVYVGGNFTNAGGNPANHIAMWNGVAWSTLGSSPNDGVSGTVYSIEPFSTDLYVGGSFTTTGSGTTVNRIAKWDGTSWSALGAGTNGNVYAIAAGTSEIYVGGAFTAAGGNPASHVAYWNGINWSTMGSPTDGVDNTVDALYANGDTVYVGGAFSNAGGNPANHVAKWNTHEWTVLAAGVNSTVYAFAGNGTDLYIGGSFSTSGLINAYHVIDWSIADSSYTTLGDGTNGTVRSIGFNNSDIYFGGTFSTAGNKPSYRFAHYNPNGVTAVKKSGSVPGSFALLQNYPNPFNPTTVISYQLTVNSNVSLKVYDILGREVATLVNGRQAAGSYSLTFDGSRFASGVYFYRLETGGFTRTMKMILMK